MLNPDKNRDTVRLLKTGSIYCFGEVFKYYFTPLCILDTQYVLGEDAEKIVQETML